MFRPCRPVNCIQNCLVCSWWSMKLMIHTDIMQLMKAYIQISLYIRRYLYRIQVRGSDIWKGDIWAIKIQLTQCLPLYAHTETIHKWACFRFTNTNILHISYRTSQVRQSCTAQQSYDELTLSCPATLGRSQVHWKVPHSSPPSGPPHSHVVCREIFATAGECIQRNALSCTKENYKCYYITYTETAATHTFPWYLATLAASDVSSCLWNTSANSFW